MVSQASDSPTGADKATRFGRETSVVPIGGGLYRAILHQSWWIITGPNGGYIAAILLRAMVAAVDDASRRPRSLTVQYLRPPTEGDVIIEVVTERSGRTVTNLTARMTQDDKLIALALGAFGTDKPDSLSFDESNGLADVVGLESVPVPESVEVVEVDPDRDVPMRAHYDLRWVIGALPFTTDGAAGERARSGGWLRPVEQVPVDEVVLAAMSDAWMPPVFSKLAAPAPVPTVDLTIHFRSLPADPLGFCFVLFESPVASHGYLVEHGQLLAPDGTLLAESRQLAVLA
ncbi:MAG: thioesterase family protein [Microthrixaceae bacterium]|nr:thioesterase family protein [Microthrixaceae bacterium]